MSLPIRYLNCKSCSVNIQIRSDKCLYYVCTDCGSIHANYQGDFTKVFTTAPIREDMTVLRIGAEGKADGNKFLLTGRIRYEFEAGYLNHWNVLYENGEPGFLEECYGSYMLSRIESCGIAHHQLVQLRAGKEIIINTKKKFYVTAVKTNTGYASEGELYEKAQPEKGFIQIEMSGAGKEAVCINFFSKDQMDVYIGSYFDFAELNFHNTRNFNGWQ